MKLAHALMSAGKQCAGCSKFPSYIDYNAHGFQFHQKVVQGHVSNFLKHIIARSSSGDIFGSSLDRFTTPAPTAPCVTTVMRTRLLACGRLPGQPKDSWRGSVVPSHDDEPATSGHEPTWIRPLRPSREQLLHSRQRLVLLEPPTLSLCLAAQSAIYSYQCGLERHALIVHF
jgi:hypothetical protein